MKSAPLLASFFFLIGMVVWPALAINPDWIYKTGKNNPILDIAITDDGKYIVFTDGSLYFLSTAPQLLRHGLRAKYVDLSPDNSVMAVGSDNGVCLVSWEGETLWCNDEPASDPIDIRIMKDNRSIYFTSNGLGRLYKLSMEGAIEWSRPVGQPVYDISFPDDGSYSVITSYKEQFVSLDKNGRQRFIRNPESSNELDLFPIAVSKDGDYIAGGMRYANNGKVFLFNDWSIILWEYQTEGQVKEVAISYQGALIAAVDWHLVHDTDSTLYFFEVNRTSNQGNLSWKKEIPARITSLDMTPNGSYLVVGSTDSNIYIFNRTGGSLGIYSMGEIVRLVSITSDGRHVVAASNGILAFFSLPNQSTTEPTQIITVPTLENGNPLPSTTDIHQVTGGQPEYASSSQFMRIVTVLIVILFILLAVSVVIAIRKSR